MRLGITLLNLLAGVLLIGCDQTETTGRPQAAKPVAQLPLPPAAPANSSRPIILSGPPHQFDRTAYAILPWALGVEYRFPKSKPARLSEAELEQVDKLLAQSVAEFNRAQEKDFREAAQESPELSLNRKNYVIDLPTYKRQVVAVINRKGEKEVWVNCFCADYQPSDWQKQEVDVTDGGNCFFNLKINLATATCYDMMADGMA